MTTPPDAQIIVAAFTFLTFVVGGIFAYFVRRQDRRDLDAKEAREMTRRAADRLERLTEAARIESLVDTRARQFAETIDLKAQVKSLLDEKTHAETMAAVAATHETAKAAEAGAAAAFHEANSVNVKIADMQTNLERTLEKLPAPHPETTEPPTATISGTFVGTPDKP